MRYVDPSVQDAALSRIAEADEMHACTRQPVDYADLANCSTVSTPMDPSDFVLEAGNGGRVLRIMPKPGVESTGSAEDVNHVALASSSEQLLLFVAVGNQVPTTAIFDFHEWFIEVTNPVWNQ